MMFVAAAALLGRLLAPADFAFVALVASFYVVSMELLDMGTSAVAARQITAHPETERSTLQSLLALRRWLAVALVGVLVGVLLLAMWLAPALRERAPSALQSAVLAAAALGLFMLHLHGWQLVFQLRQAYGRVIVLGLGTQLAFLLTTAAALRLRAAGVTIAALVVLRELVMAIGTRRLAQHLLLGTSGGTRLCVPWLDAGMAPLLRQGWMIGLAGVSYKLAVHSGVFALYQPDSPEVLARFSAAHRLLIPLVDLAWLVAGPLFASVGLAAASGHQALRTQLTGHVTLALGLAGVLAVAAWFAAPTVISLLYGDVYLAGPDSAVDSFRWLAVGSLFAWVTPVLVVAETTLGHARALLLLGLACLAMALLGNAWAIPRLGAQGAALVLCLCETFVCLALLGRLLARRDIRLTAGWLLYGLPALGLLLALAALQGRAVGQLLLVLAWVPVSAWGLSKLPAQQACRHSMARTAAPWSTPSPSDPFKPQTPFP